eukprot:gnl/TRDRNA2_/TRDRNA2_93342_c0_seq1.p1 gnl/TRDRNA2_/TRDRNA2_93342_c0~~gnl/TRDRNA2_/TRDRNA2_93342_c0_seq1.p1  ORF type:complete len:390 (+),score=89.76 gnl/TRDRNA2_/TRDRNA2_93342_c0_seq1:123-1292(+)
MGDEVDSPTARRRASVRHGGGGGLQQGQRAHFADANLPMAAKAVQLGGRHSNTNTSGAAYEEERLQTMRRRNRDYVLRQKRRSKHADRHEQFLAARYLELCTDYKEMRCADRQKQLRYVGNKSTASGKEALPSGIEGSESSQKPLPEKADDDDEEGIVEEICSDMDASGEEGTGSVLELAADAGKFTEAAGQARQRRHAVFTRARKKQLAEAIALVPHDEKSITQEAHERFQGLQRSKEGIEILDAGSQNQKELREALLRYDADAVEIAKKKEVEEGVVEELLSEDALDVGFSPYVSEKILARRFRFRMIHNTASQVSQFRMDMSTKIEEAAVTPGYRSAQRDDSIAASASPARSQWIRKTQAARTRTSSSAPRIRRDIVRAAKIQAFP